MLVLRNSGTVMLEHQSDTAHFLQWAPGSLAPHSFADSEQTWFALIIPSFLVQRRQDMWLYRTRHKKQYHAEKTNPCLHSLPSTPCLFVSQVIAPLDFNGGAQVSLSAACMPRYIAQCSHNASHRRGMQDAHCTREVAWLEIIHWLEIINCFLEPPRFITFSVISQIIVISCANLGRRTLRTSHSEHLRRNKRGRMCNMLKSDARIAHSS